MYIAVSVQLLCFHIYSFLVCNLFFRGMPVAGHGKVSAEFSRCKTYGKFDWQLKLFLFPNILRSRDSAILSRTVICKHNSCDSGNEHSAILARRGNKQKVRHFRRHFDIVYWIEHHPFRATHRANKFTVHSACQTNQQVQQPNLRVQPAYVPNA